jgi:hypothetical protein
VKDIGPKTKDVIGKSARLLRKPSAAKRSLPWRFRFVLGAGGFVLVLVGFLLRRKL